AALDPHDGEGETTMKTTSMTHAFMIDNDLGHDTGAASVISMTDLAGSAADSGLADHSHAPGVGL
ncbi:MAG: hypothetical protein EBR79_02760, partial [Proteobacteria bacterium]|nr:hypothetical protein [Pseudomonadota bacterium]